MTPPPWTRDYLALANSIRVAGERLARLPVSPQSTALKSVLRVVADDAALWSARAPQQDAQQRMLTKMLAIHFAVAALVPRTR